MVVRRKGQKGMLVSIVGPTAVGKTAFSIMLARHFSTDILSVDSRQFFIETTIGTAKPTKEELHQIKHHFINTLSIRDSYNAGKFEGEALDLLTELFKKYRLVVAVGGSGLYFKALWRGMDTIPETEEGVRKELTDEMREEGMEKLLEELMRKDPEYYLLVDKKNPQRIIRALEVIRSTGQPFSAFHTGVSEQERPFRSIKIGLALERQDLYARIDRRVDEMIAAGLFEEAASLYNYRDYPALQTVGYSEIFGYMDGRYDREEAIRLLKRNSRRYAKRQLTWFRKDPEIVWMSPDDLPRAKTLISEQLEI